MPTAAPSPTPFSVQPSASPPPPWRSVRRKKHHRGVEPRAPAASWRPTASPPTGAAAPWTLSRASAVASSPATSPPARACRLIRRSVRSRLSRRTPGLPRDFHGRRGAVRIPQEQQGEVCWLITGRAMVDKVFKTF